MPTKYLIERDVTGLTNGTGFGLPFSIDGEKVNLAQNVAQSIVVPATYANWVAVIGVPYNARVFVDGINAATLPTGTFTASTTELIPVIGMARFVTKGQTLSFITPETGGAYVTVKFYVTGYYQN